MSMVRRRVIFCLLPGGERSDQCDTQTEPADIDTCQPLSDEGIQMCASCFYSFEPYSGIFISI